MFPSPAGSLLVVERLTIGPRLPLSASGHKNGHGRRAPFRAMVDASCILDLQDFSTYPAGRPTNLSVGWHGTIVSGL